MSNPLNALMSLLHRLGVAGPARAFAFQGSGASKIASGSGAPSSRRTAVTLAALATTLGALVFTAAPALAAAPETPELKVVLPAHATTAFLEGVLSPKSLPAEGGEYRFLYRETKLKTGCKGGAETAPGLDFGVEHQEVTQELTALTAGTEYTVCLADKNLGGETLSTPVSFTTATPPEAPQTKSPATSITTESAVLEGVLDPKGAGNPGTYEFLYRESATECEGEKTVGAGAMTGAEGQAVSTPVSELLPGATYTFCLLARNEAGEVTVGNKVTFTALPVKPTLESEAATSITKTTATLTAKVNPNGAQITSCTFEYGTSTAYGPPVPCVHPDAAEVGAGRSPVPVSVPLTERKPNITYHWRLSVSNAAGTSTGRDHTFIDEAPEGLPDGRAYELVTPPQKNGALIGGAIGGGSAWPPRIAQDGKDLIAPSIQCFAGAESCIGGRLREGEAYEFARTSKGWVTNALAPPVTKFGSSTQWSADADKHMSLFSAASPPEGQDDFYLRSPEGTLADIGPIGEGPEGPDVGTGSTIKKLSEVNGVQATADFSHVLFYGKRLWSLDGQPEEPYSLFEYARTGSTRPLSVGVTGAEGSTSLISACETAPGGPIGRGGAHGSLSEDGRTVYFTAAKCEAGGAGENAGRAVPAEELYARVEGETREAHTVKISAFTPSTCTTSSCESSSPQEADFEGASADGSRAFFTSNQPLTDNASEGEGEAGEGCHEAGLGGCNLYESVCAEPCGTPGEEPAANGRQLIDISEGAKATGGPRVQGVMAISTDGSHVYFVARGVLTGEQQNQAHEKAKDGEDNLYVYAEGHGLRYVATLPESDEANFPAAKSQEWSAGIELANVTPDGRFLVFLSHGALTPDDTRSAAESPPAQVYRYDALSGRLVRISIGAHGFNDNGNAGTQDANIAPAFFGSPAAGAAGPGRADPTMSHDGEYVFFESPVALTPGALNDVEVPYAPGQPAYAENIYEYHNGTVSLISDGKDTSPKSATPGVGNSVRLLGSDESGTNVFFATNDQLTAQDTDTSRDYYDARICTPEEPCYSPPAATTPCTEEGCRGTAPGAPAAQTPASQSFNGPGNLTPPTATTVKPKPLTRAQKLAKALKQCRKGKSKSKRVRCEKQARKHFGTASKARKSTHGKRRAK